MKEVLAVNDPGLNAPAAGLHALRQTHDPGREFHCWKYGLAGHMSRDCTFGGMAADKSSQTALNALAQDEALFSLLHKQERVQEKLIEAQARVAQYDAKAAAIPSESFPLATLATYGPPSTPMAPLITGGVQPEGYVYVGLHREEPVWGHVDIVAASIDVAEEAGAQAKHT